MALLGAQLEDLDTLATRLTGTASAVETARSAAVALTSAVVGDVTTAAQRAYTQIGTEMGALDQSVADASLQAESTQWTGSNADNFRSAAATFRTAINRSETSTNEAFENFKATIEAMSTTLDEYTASLSTSLTEATTAAEGMAQAVTDQRTNLDNVMNRGISAF